ncbi:signal transduction histidine kinase [Streptacidiphilus sp. MAP12-16]|uniref:sensor histidine kinase n=1 Tax=Streptacidiphilus sp. MAP12-16 TaxID=3156300 RepID=UPI00351368CA
MYSLVVDVVIALAFTGVSMLLGQNPPPEGWHHLHLDALGYVLICLVNIPVAARRRAPVAVCVFICLMWIWFIAAGYWPVVNCLAPLLALYTVAATRPLRVALACATLSGAVWVYAGLMGLQSSMPTVVGQSVLFCAVMCRFGFAARVSAERGEQLTALTEQLRREQEQRARQAVTEERVRIARELHDVVAHHMSVISVQAGLAGYVFSTDPPTARGALGTIAATSREALEEMRRMLALLRVGPEGTEGSGGGVDDEEQSYAPAPNLERLGELVERVSGAGVPVRLQVDGAARRLPAGVGLCAYRVVQEALTNVLKHARPCQATVTVHYRGDQLRISVADDGRRPVPAVLPGSSGHGLIGMRERARILGGAVTAGPRAHGGFQVQLTLPLPTTSEDSRASRTE